MKVKLFLGLAAVLICLVGIVLAVDGGANTEIATGTAPAQAALASLAANRAAKCNAGRAIDSQ